MRIGVFGIGNVLTGDDAFGPTVLASIDARWEFPANVVLADLGTPSLDLVERLSDFDIAIFIDAVAASGEPGTVVRYSRDELLVHPPGLRLSPHEPSLKETLLTLEFLGEGPRVVLLIGVVPEQVERFGLSDRVKEAIPFAAELVIDELARLGVHAERRRTPIEEKAWWTSASSA